MKKVLWVSINKPSISEIEALDVLFNSFGGADIVHVPEFIVSGKTIIDLFNKNRCDEIVVDGPYPTVAELADSNISPVKPIIPFYIYVNIPGKLRHEKRFMYFERVKELHHTSDILI